MARIAWNKRTREEIEKIVNDLEYILLDEYTDGRYRKVAIQNSEGYKWDGLLTNLVRPNRKISFFDVRNIYVLLNIEVWLKINKPDFELCSGNTYEGNDKNLKFYHKISECKEEFYMCWANISQGQGCPVCRGMQVGKHNNLLYLRPDLAKEWHSDNTLRPENVTVGSAKKVYWLCSNANCGYGENKEWFAKINKRTSGKGCPACSNPSKVVRDKNRLSIVFPEIAREWDYEKNKDTPDDVSYGSNKKRWWICQKGHSYVSVIKNRTKGQGCNQCSNSKGEDKILSWIESNITNLKSIGITKCVQEKRFHNCRNKNTLPFDFGLEYTNSTWYLIEFHGGQHYFPIDFAGRGEKWANKEFETNKKRDKIKKNYCKKNNIPFLIIPYWEFDNIEKILEQTFFG